MTINMQGTVVRAPPRTLYEKLWRSRMVRRIDAEHVLLYVDLHVMNEYTSPQAFSGLRAAGRDVWRKQAHVAIVDHVNSTRHRSVSETSDPAAALLIRTLASNCAEFGIELFDLTDDRQGICHIVVPERGLALPGMVIACGDSHTTTYGALGALGLGIGTSEVEHVLATQTLVYRPLQPMRIRIDGELGPFSTPKDVILAVIDRIGANGANGYAVEFTGSIIHQMSIEGRMTLCNMAVEAGARAAVIAPDAKTTAYLRSRSAGSRNPVGNPAAHEWPDLRTDPGAVFDREIELDAAAVAPLVTWGTSPEHVVPIDREVPDPALESDPARRVGMQRALEYMGLEPGTRLEGLAIDCAFIGSCTNSRIEDLRAAATVARNGRVAAHVRAIVVPGSWQVRRQAESEGVARVLIDAGFEWRQPGCSMCLAMNDDIAAPGERCASSTNRNFEGRQGRGARTHLMSPAMVAAAALAGHLTDVRRMCHLN
jgi:3-isopropylmalate/(R)-2-methylmalate dehydratase large subunit